MSDPDLILTLLRELRAKADATDAKVDALSAKIDSMDTRFEARFDIVDQRLTVLEVAVQHLSNDMHLVKAHLRKIVDTAIADLQRRMARIEAK
ncbi:MAG TPA: hypothetical protein VL326_18705 [Kofleriaceae bacterium]|nr:hypothetical protein [Kofleriaceae bacterium]